MHALQCRLGFDTRRVDNLVLAHMLDADILDALNVRSRLGGDTGAEGAHVAAVSALAVLQEADEHFERAVEDGLNVC